MSGSGAPIGATSQVWHLGEGAACLAGTPPPGAPLWRLPPRDRLVGSEPETFISVIRAAFAALHPDRRGLLAKAALRFKGGREPRATRTSCARTQGRGRHACSVNQDAPRRRPH